MIKTGYARHISFYYETNYLICFKLLCFSEKFFDLYMLFLGKWGGGYNGKADIHPPVPPRRFPEDPACENYR